LAADVKTKLRVRGFWSQSTSRIREEIEPVRLAVKRIEESVKIDLKRRQNISRDERGALKTGLIRASQTHRRLLARIRSGMKGVA
jgi:hypothetical protein